MVELPITSYKADVLRITKDGVYAEFWAYDKHGDKLKLLLTDGELKRDSIAGYHSIENPNMPSAQLMKQYGYHTEKFIKGLAAHVHKNPSLGQTACHDLQKHLIDWQEKRHESLGSWPVGELDISPIIHEIEAHEASGLGNWKPGTAANLRDTNKRLDERRQFVEDNYEVSAIVRAGSRLFGGVVKGAAKDDDPQNASKGR